MEALGRVRPKLCLTVTSDSLTNMGVKDVLKTMTKISMGFLGVISI